MCREGMQSASPSFRDKMKFDDFRWRFWRFYLQAGFQGADLEIHLLRIQLRLTLGARL